MSVHVCTFVFELKKLWKDMCLRSMSTAYFRGMGMAWKLEAENQKLYKFLFCRNFYKRNTFFF